MANDEIRMTNDEKIIEIRMTNDAIFTFSHLVIFSANAAGIIRMYFWFLISGL